MIHPKKLKQIETAQNALFKKFGVVYAQSIVFPSKKVPLVGRFCLWILDRLGGRIKLKVVEVGK